jgi:hypothetical protein
MSAPMTLPNMPKLGAQSQHPRQYAESKHAPTHNNILP